MECWPKVKAMTVQTHPSKMELFALEGHKTEESGGWSTSISYSSGEWPGAREWHRKGLLGWKFDLGHLSYSWCSYPWRPYSKVAVCNSGTNVGFSPTEGQVHILQILALPLTSSMTSNIPISLHLCVDYEYNISNLTTQQDDNPYCHFTNVKTDI